VIPDMKRLVYFFISYYIDIYLNPFTKAPPKIDNNPVSTTIGQNFQFPGISGKYFLKKYTAMHVI
jgi:hypothetical protein